AGPARERRRRSSLGRPPLPLLHHHRRQPRHPGRPVRPEGELPSDEEVAERVQAAAATAAALSNTSPRRGLESAPFKFHAFKGEPWRFPPFGIPLPHPARSGST